MILEVGELRDERSCELQCTNHQMWKSSLGRVVFKITLHKNYWVAITTQKVQLSSFLVILMSKAKGCLFFNWCISAYTAYLLSFPATFPDAQDAVAARQQDKRGITSFLCIFSRADESEVVFCR